MSAFDPYGYDARRAEIAAQAGYSISYANRIYPDEVLYASDVEREASGMPFVPEAFGTVCRACDAPTHLIDDEVAVAVDIMNEVAYVYFDYLDRLKMGKKADTLQDDYDRAFVLLREIGDINRARCVEIKIKKAVTHE